MDYHEMFVKFCEYCQTCEYAKLGENESPCSECLEHPVNIDSIRPVCYKERS